MDKIIQVTRSSMPPISEYINEITPVWDNRWLTNFGVIHEKFREQLKIYLGVKGISLGVNGHMCLECAIEALGLKGEIITTPFTFVSTTNAIIRKGLMPVFCDIKEDDFTIDASRIEELITPRTSAILGVHVYGNLCDDSEIKRIAQKHGIKVIYDAAHAFGESKNEIGVGNMGDISMFSFHATKVFNSIEGGCLTYSDPELEKRIQVWSNFGIDGKEKLVNAGGNYKMNEFAAAMGVCNLRHVADYISSREQVYQLYCQGLQGVDGIGLNFVQEGVKSNYSYYPIIVNPEEYGHDRDELFTVLDDIGIKTRKYFYPLTSTLFAIDGYVSKGNTPIAQKVSDRVLALPMYEGLEKDDVERICGAIRHFAHN